MKWKNMQWKNMHMTSTRRVIEKRTRSAKVSLSSLHSLFFYIQLTEDKQKQKQETKIARIFNSLPPAQLASDRQALPSAETRMDCSSDPIPYLV